MNDKPKDQDKDNDHATTLEETAPQKEIQESNNSSKKLGKPRQFDEIVKMSEYFSAFPKQCRK